MLPIPMFPLALTAQQPPPSSQRRPPQAPETIQAAALNATAKKDPSPPKAVTRPEPDARTRAAQSLVDAELAFAKMAEEQGSQAAFLKVLDDLGVLFRPGPVNGKAWLRQRKPDASKLTWFPSFVEVSEAGDLGYTTGPYQWRANAESKQAAHGHFVSIWGRRAGTWKLLLDMGSAHAAQGEEDPLFEPENTKGPGKVQPLPMFTPEALQNLEEEFSNVASVRGILIAYNSFLAPGARIYREGAQPTTQLDDIRRTLEQVRGNVKWTCLGSAVARSLDLGYAYGLREYDAAATARTGPGNPHGPVARNSFFLHVWKRQASGRWKVVLDIENLVQ
ncbi:MAG: nuclear transport factor 2 family protein [Acidobacteriota bacterium]|nr:nuclear transport factor 2 family protein [Acidobacteriota bacterium]